MKKVFTGLMCLLISIIAPVNKLQAQDPISEVIRQAIIKAIKAADLQVQRLQTKTIWLQNAQKVVENELSKLKLQEIADWAHKQQALYKDYFEELWKVKTALSYYHSIKEITAKQLQFVKEYKRAVSLYRQDTHFTPGELTYMEQVYAGMLEESARNLDEVLLIARSFSTQMSDASRIEILNTAANKLDENYNDLNAFNQENALLSLSRSKDENEISLVKAIYRLQ